MKEKELNIEELKKLKRIKLKWKVCALLFNISAILYVLWHVFFWLYASLDHEPIPKEKLEEVRQDVIGIMIGYLLFSVLLVFIPMWFYDKLYDYDKEEKNLYWEATFRNKIQNYR